MPPPSITTLQESSNSLTLRSLKNRLYESVEYVLHGYHLHYNVICFIGQMDCIYRIKMSQLPLKPRVRHTVLCLLVSQSSEGNYCLMKTTENLQQLMIAFTMLGVFPPLILEIHIIYMHNSKIIC